MTVGTTTSRGSLTARLPGPTSFARRPDRCRRDELPRLPDPARRDRGDGALDRFFDPWVGPLSTRFAATFVLVAGVGVTLLTRSSAGRPDHVQAKRWTLVRRGLALYGAGLLLDRSGRARSCRTTASCSSSPPRCSRCAAVGHRHRRSGRTGRRGDRMVGARTLARRAPSEVVVRAGFTFSAGTAVRRRRQRDPSAASVAGVLLRRHRVRSGPVRRTCGGSPRSAAA